MGKVVMYSSMSVDGFIADENEQPGPLFDWLLNGDVPLDETGCGVADAYDYTGPYWDHAQHLLEDPDVVIQGDRVLHLRYQVRR